MDRRIFLVMTALAITISAYPGEVSAAQGNTSAAVLFSSRTFHRVVALTFDDGPSRYSLQILDVLRRHHVTATFFVVGAHVHADPAIVSAEARAGNDIGNHTYTHADLRWYTDAWARQQLNATQEAVVSAAHITPHWFRPPYGGVNLRVAGVAAGLRLHTVMWSVDPQDWRLPGSTAIAVRVLNSVRPGSIIILHDGGGFRGETVQALPILLQTLQARGYRFISLDEMFFPGIRRERCRHSSSLDRPPCSGQASSPIRAAPR